MLPSIAMAKSVASWVVTALGLISAASAFPVDARRRDVSSSQLNTFNLFEQYAAAAYCVAFDEASKGSVISCSAGNCPQPQTAGATLVYGFDGIGDGGVTGYIALDNTNHVVVLAFRGSESLDNWIEDLTFTQTSVSSLCSGCEAHEGFWDGWQSVKPTLLPYIQSTLSANPGYGLVLVGHSLGAALASLAATDLRASGMTLDTYTFGCPRVGNLALADFITAQSGGTNYRFTHTDDPVPKLPPELFGYAQPSPEYWITTGNNVAVTTSSITVIQGVNSDDGNAGTGGLDTSAHEWYFNAISACS